MVSGISATKLARDPLLRAIAPIPSTRPVSASPGYASNRTRTGWPIRKSAASTWLAVASTIIFRRSAIRTYGWPGVQLIALADLGEFAVPVDLLRHHEPLHRRPDREPVEVRLGAPRLQRCALQFQLRAAQLGGLARLQVGDLGVSAARVARASSSVSANFCASIADRTRAVERSSTALSTAAFATRIFCWCASISAA